LAIGNASGKDVEARSLLSQGKANIAIAVLQEALSANPQDAQAHNLLCRVYYQEERWSDAVRECQTAVQLDHNNSEYHDWLGRVYGEQAQRAAMLTAYGLAKKVHAEFVAAVQLDPHNVPALCDLGEFTVDAPGFLGGGLDKAGAIAAQLRPLDAGKYHWLLAKIAGKKKDPATAERELKLAIASSKAPAEAWMDLASFYGRQGDLPAMEQAVQRGRTADRAPGAALVDGASILLRYKRNFPLAEQMLRQYLTSDDLTEGAPAFQVHDELGALMARQGRTTEAQQEYVTAQALDSGDATIRQHAQ
jgi:Flp pilus assembly protein TadD